METIIYKILEKLIDKLDVATVRKFFRVFRSLILALIPICLAISGILFYRMFTQVSQGEKMLTEAIVAQYESTAETYKALEALVLSGLDKESNLKDKTVSDDTLASLDALLTPTSTTKKLNMQIKVKEGHDYLIAVGSRNFLMATSRALPDDFDDSKPVENAFAQDPNLKKTIDTLFALDDKLCPFNGRPLADDLPPVVQTYVISEKNVIALCGAEESQNADYEREYAGDRDFTSRPYWRDTVGAEHPPSEGKSHSVDQYFHATPSYIDTAGNGFARSFCRDLTLPPSKRRNAMICFDTATGGTTAQKLTADKMHAFAGDVARVNCNLSGCTDTEWGPYELLESLSSSLAGWLFPVDAQLHSIAEGELTKEYKEAERKGNLEEISGRLRVLSSNSDQTVAFSIPFGKGENNSNTFLLSEIRLGVFQQSSFGKGLWAGGCLIIALMLLVGAFVESGLRLEQQLQVKQRLSDLMNKVPVAYCYCNEGDVTQFINPPFAHLLGYRNAASAFEELKTKSFDKLLFGDHDVEVYERIKKQRENGRVSQVYEVSLTNGNERVPVKVYSTSLPNAVSRSKKGSETFGLFFPKNSPILQKEDADRDHNPQHP